MPEAIKSTEFMGMRYVPASEATEILEPGFDEIISEIETGFRQFAEGKAVSPPFINFSTPGLSGIRGHVHFKAGYVEGDKHFVMKYSGGFWGNREAGIVAGTDSGFFIIFSAETGKPEMLVEGGDYTLTDYRTAAAGAVSAKWLSNPESKTVGVIGNGVEAKLQVIALTHVRQIETVKVWGRNSKHVEEYVRWMKTKLPKVNFIACQETKDAVTNVDILVTAMPTSEPTIFADWVSPGTHITAVGACGPTMQELDAKVFAKADRVYADSVEACIVNGDLHHAVEEQTIKRSDITGELGQVILGKVVGRKSKNEITIIDLIGLGVQDAKIGNWFYGKVS